MSDYAPVLVTVYHRFYAVKQCIAALQENEEAKFTDLYVASDGPARPEHTAIIEKIRTYVRGLSGFKSVHLLARTDNWGAFRSCREAFKEVLREHDKIIFMEDDIIPSRYYLKYLNDGLDAFADDNRVFAICGYKSKYKIPSGYAHDVLTLPRFSPWGYAVWKNRLDGRYDGRFGFKDTPEAYDRWSEFKKHEPQKFAFLEQNDQTMLNILKADSEGCLKAGDIRVEYFLQRTNMVCIYPRQTMTRVLSTGQDAVHATIRWVGDEPLAGRPLRVSLEDLEVNERIYRAFLSALHIPLYRRAWHAFLHEGFGNAFRYYWGRMTHKRRTSVYKQ